MEAGATGQDLNALNTCIEGLVERQGDGVIRGQASRKMARHSKRSGFRLLIDFLEHEVTEMALIRDTLLIAQHRGRALHPITGRPVAITKSSGWPVPPPDRGRVAQSVDAPPR